MGRHSVCSSARVASRVAGSPEVSAPKTSQSPAAKRASANERRACVVTALRRVVGERVGAVVARGEAEIGFQQVSVLMAVAGIDYVGPLPGEAQRVTLFSAGIAAVSKAPEAARAFIRFLASAEAAAEVEKNWLEPVAAR